MTLQGCILATFSYPKMKSMNAKRFLGNNIYLSTCCVVILITQCAVVRPCLVILKQTFVLLHTFFICKKKSKTQLIVGRWTHKMKFFLDFYMCCPHYCVSIIITSFRWISYIKMQQMFRLDKMICPHTFQSKCKWTMQLAYYIYHY